MTPNDVFQRLLLMFEVALRGLHEIGDQVVPALQLHVNLRKRVFKTVSQLNQLIVNTDDPKNRDHRDEGKNSKNYPCDHGSDS